MDLISISPATKTVALGSAAVEVTGLSLRKLTQLVIKYPDLLALVAGKVELAKLITSAPEMALAIFAVGVVGRKARWWKIKSDDGENLLQAFDEAATGQQIEILSAIVDLTFKGERGVPFLRSVIGLRETSMPNSGQEPEPSASHDEATQAEPMPTSSSD